MACEEYLEQMEAAAIAMDEIDAEILQLQYQRSAQEGILIGSYMLYMDCLANQQNRVAVRSTPGQSPDVSKLRTWAKKAWARIKGAVAKKRSVK